MDGKNNIYDYKKYKQGVVLKVGYYNTETEKTVLFKN